MLLPFILSLLLLTATDNLFWFYHLGKGSIFIELSKIALVGFGASVYWLAKKVPAEYTGHMVVSWLFIHFPAHQILCGLLRAWDPLYLGSGWGDSFIYNMTGGAGIWPKIYYSILLAASCFVGIRELRKILKNI